MASPIEAASSGWVETVGRPLDRPAAPLTHPAIVEKSPGHLSQPSATRARYAAVAAAAKRLLADASTTLARIELCAPLCSYEHPVGPGSALPVGPNWAAQRSPVLGVVRAASVRSNGPTGQDGCLGETLVEFRSYEHKTPVPSVDATTVNALRRRS